jgi:hypothetical protein
MPETAQPAPETDEKKSRGLGSYVVWGFVVVMAYVLSSGPVLRLVPGTLSPNVAFRIYYPVAWAYLQTPLHRPIGMYWHLWLPDTYDKHGNEN